MRRIAVLGPVAPFRGGISHHTTNLCQALARVADIRIVSYRRLYPAWLYPGRFQTEEKTDTSLDGRVTFVLDSMAPRSWKTAVDHIRVFQPDCVVIPWWTFFLAPCSCFIADRLRRMNIPVIFVCHNVVDHEATAWKRWLSRVVLRNGRRFVVHSTGEKTKLEELLGDVDVISRRHPVSDQFPPARGTLPRRAALELLFYGFMRRYKGLPTLIEALALVPDLDVHLSMVGEPWGDDEAVWVHRLHEAGVAHRVELVPRYVTSAETAEYFQRADVVVLPYTAATGTAVIATAYRYGRPVLATRVSGVVDVVEDGVTGLLFPPGDAAALADAIRRVAAGALGDASASIERSRSLTTWDELATCVLGETARLEVTAAT
jgi:glycosyltransferase involved in cell wall biosynthesis